MAVRNIIKEGDEVLRKKSRNVDVIDDRIKTLLNDMAETMYSASGVGLAAPQVGILRRVVVIDVGQGLIELINPRVVVKKGKQTEAEGCLSVPEVCGVVNRPAYVEVEALDRDGKKIRVSGTDLLARCLCHEIDHLDGVLFIDKAIRFIEPSNNDN